MRLNGHPSRPSAITCCRFSSLKTLLTSMENTSTAVNVLLQFRWPVFRRPSLAGFERPPRLDQQHTGRRPHHSFCFEPFFPDLNQRLPGADGLPRSQVETVLQVKVDLFPGGTCFSFGWL